MKSSTRDETEGKLHQVKGKIKEIAGKVSMNPDLEAEGKDETFTGNAQEKIGQVKKVVGKYNGVSCSGTPSRPLTRRKTHWRLNMLTMSKALKT